MAESKWLTLVEICEYLKVSHETVLDCINKKICLHIKQVAKKVSVSLTNLARRLTGVITHLSFFQNERVEDKLLPIRIKAYFIDDNGERISNENIIIAESTSLSPEERTYKEKFTLKNIRYDKTKKYYLVLEDEEEMVNKIIEKIPFTINLVFGAL